MTNNNTTDETMQTVIAAVKMIQDTKFISSGFVLNLVIVEQLNLAGLEVSQPNIDLVIDATL